MGLVSLTIYQFSLCKVRTDLSHEDGLYSYQPLRQLLAFSTNMMVTTVQCGAGFLAPF